MTLGEKIRTIRNSRNMTQEQLAQEAGISLGAIKKYESNDRKPKSDQLQKIADAFQISVNVFIENEVNTISDFSKAFSIASPIFKILSPTCSIDKTLYPSSSILALKLYKLLSYIFPGFKVEFISHTSSPVLIIETLGFL